MARIDILTVVPELLESPLNHSIVQRAKNKGLVDMESACIILEQYLSRKK